MIDPSAPKYQAEMVLLGKQLARQPIEVVSLYYKKSHQATLGLGLSAMYVFLGIVALFGAIFLPNLILAAIALAAYGLIIGKGVVMRPNGSIITDMTELEWALFEEARREIQNQSEQEYN